METKADYLFEVSWEVCNKVGGIYAVVKSKAAEMVKHYSNNFFMIGPYFADQAAREFQPTVVPDNLKQIFNDLGKEGIVAYYGKWLLNCKPNTILIDFSRFSEKKNEIKSKLWEDYKIDSLNSDSFFDDPVVWSTAVGKLLEKLCGVMKGKVVAHFHEWIAGAGLLYLKSQKSCIATVFTTHATTLGRTIAGNNQDLYENMEKINFEEAAKQYNVQSKHGLESACANNADVFTTVSEITGIEAKHILKKEPDILVPNGLDTDKLPNLEEIPIKHKVFKDKIKDFIIPYFFPYYSFELEDTQFYYISGRYEFRNKGLDITIGALGKLNDQLKKENSNKTIVVFIFVPADIGNINLNILESKAIFNDIKGSVDDVLPEIKKEIIRGIVNKRLPNKKDLFDEDFVLEMKKAILNFKKEGDIPLSTHEIKGWQHDPVINGLKSVGINNRKEDRVKVIFYPCYLTSNDGLLDLDYYSAVWGCQLGIFPSYYEPWGYTPMESAAYGVPAITTDLAGFGMYLLKENPEDNSGIYVIKRQGVSYNDSVKQLAERLYWYASLNKKERIDQKRKGEAFARTLGWNTLADHYIHAHNMAIDKKWS